MEVSLPKVSCISCLQHPSSVVGACIQEVCESPRLFCEECRPFHSQHQCIPLQQLSRIANRVSLSQHRSEHCKALLQLLRESYNSAVEWTSSMRKSVSSALTLHEQRVGAWYRTLSEYLQREIAEQPLLCNNPDWDLKRSVVEQVLKKGNIRTAEHLESSYKASLQSQYAEESAKLHTLQDRLQGIYLDLVSSLKELGKQTEAALARCQFGYLCPRDMLLVQNLAVQQQFKWDTHLRHRDISLAGGLAYRQLETTSDSSVAALIGVNLSAGPECFEWSLRIVEKSMYVGVGICLQSKAREANFIEDSWDNPGHGHYLHGSAGGIYSHSDPSINKGMCSFGFGVGDVVTLHYNRTTGTLRISTNEADFSFKVQQCPTGDMYRPCVYLSRAGDCVELISYK